MLCSLYGSTRKHGLARKISCVILYLQNILTLIIDKLWKVMGGPGGIIKK